jgi:2-desacetyl-2-hydroxyethyl bacteriochlorophyllide A dehydrogenase
MKTWVCRKPGDFSLEEIPMPQLLTGGAIIKIKRIGICGTDLHAYEGTQPYFSYPRILGHELSGILTEIDGDLDFKIGQKVSIIPYFHCGNCLACRTGKTNCCTKLQVFGVHIDGGMSEYISVPKSALIAGENLDFDAQALVEPLAIGAHGIKRAGVSPGEYVLVIGAGPIGLGTMEFARIAGANVIALDLNDSRLNFCKNSLKVPYVINALTENVTEKLSEITDGDMPTVVIDATGNQKAINNAFQYLAHGGRYVLIGLQKGEITFSHPEFHKREGTLMSSRNATREDFDHVLDCLAKNQVDPNAFINYRMDFEEVKDKFDYCLNPENGVIKAMIEIP